MVGVTVGTFGHEDSSVKQSPPGSAGTGEEVQSPLARNRSIVRCQALLVFAGVLSVVVFCP